MSAEQQPRQASPDTHPPGYDRHRQAFWRLFLGVSLLCATSACDEKLSPPIGERIGETPQRGGTLHTAFFTGVRTLDPAVGFSTTNAALGSLMFDTLVTYDAQGKLMPGLAERYSVSPDGKRYLFQLRRGVRFHDGSELTADDVVRSVRRTLHPDTPSPASFYDRIAGFEAYRKGKSKKLGVHAESEYSVSFELSEPDSTFLHVMALQLVAPLCKSAGDVWSKDFGNAPCGTGPFKLVRYEPNQYVRFARHEAYWQPGKPYLDGVEWLLNVQPFAQRYKLERGELDYVREFSRADLAKLRGDQRWLPFGEWEEPHTVFGAFMNTELPPFDDRHMRRAVAFAIDREHIAGIRPGQIVPQYKLVPNVIIPATPGYPVQRYDLDAALEEMRLAGYPYDPKSGEGGYPKEIDYYALVDSFGQQTAEITQQELSRIGIRIKLRLVGWPTMQAITGRRKTATMGTTGWHPDFPEPSNFFESTLSSQAISEENCQNNAFFSNAELDELMKKARGNSDAAERQRLYRRAEAIVTREAPWVFTHSQRYYEVTQPYVHGYHPHPVLTQYVRWSWIDSSQLSRRVACLLPGERCAAAALPASFQVPFGRAR
ncbi:MAG: ABC transporter substrate-binding protein [Polyangiaceae bacterium]